MTQESKLILILIAIFSTGLISSLIVRFAVFSLDESDAVHIGLVAPISGASAEIGKSMQNGVELYLDIFNRNGGLDGKPVVVDVLDDNNDVVAAKNQVDQLISSAQAFAVIGHWSSDVVQAVVQKYQQNKIVLVTPAIVTQHALAGNDWSYSVAYEQRQQTRFFANYLRNVMGRKIVTVIHQNTEYSNTLFADYEKTYIRFGTKIHYKWLVDETSTNPEEHLKGVVTRLKETKDAGIVVVAMDAITAAKFVKMARDAGVKNLIAGTDQFASRAFLQTLEDFPGKSKNAAKYVNKIVASSPMLFDTANELAKNFRADYLDKYGQNPDWIAAYAYESAFLIVEAMVAKKIGSNTDLVSGRSLIKDYMAAMTAPGNGKKGITGNNFFDANRQAQKPVQMGKYNGSQLVSTATQLQSIKSGLEVDYIGELKDGRMLYVNDRFMYKTNVVYTGIKIHEFSELDFENNTFKMDFSIWFRYRGKFSPNEIEFINAVEPVVFEQPVETLTTGKSSFVLYRAKAKFFFDFLETRHPYGSHVMGTSFQHKNLDRNNVVYVVDELGIGLGSGTNLNDLLVADRVLSPLFGWEIDRAWIAQDIAIRSSFGKPTYVGFGSADPHFSRINLGLIISEGKLSARDVIPLEFFIYICIFGVIGILSAMVVDANTKGYFWNFATWALRVVFWPLFLLSAGNLFVEMAFRYLPLVYLEQIIRGYDLLWWVLPCWLIDMAVERFLWAPLEGRTGRIIPNVIRLFGSFTVYLLGFLGIVAFVYGQALTSLLATGGLFAMIIGLAVQANIANVFSGIVVNIERPFSVGDWIKFGNMDEGKVIDITWRTLRLETRSGIVISIPNAQASEAALINYSRQNTTLKVEVHVSVQYEPERIIESLISVGTKVAAGADVSVICSYGGIINIYGSWVAVYNLIYELTDYSARPKTRGLLWKTIWYDFAALGIPLEANRYQTDVGGEAEKPLEEGRLEVEEGGRLEDGSGRLEDAVVADGLGV